MKQLPLIVVLGLTVGLGCSSKKNVVGNWAATATQYKITLTSDGNFSSDFNIVQQVIEHSQGGYTWVDGDHIKFTVTESKIIAPNVTDPAFFEAMKKRSLELIPQVNVGNSWKVDINGDRMTLSRDGETLDLVRL